MEERSSLGDQELDLLQYVAARAPVTAREIADGYGEDHGLARSTVLTMIERLRRKGYLDRRRRDGVYRYSPKVAPSEVLNRVVRRFVEKTLGGSVSPVVAYLAQGPDLSDDDLAELQKLVDSLKAGRVEESR